MSEKASLFVIINHTAARARETWPLVRAELERACVGFEAHESTREGETEEKAREAFAGGFGTVAAVGGDGTLSAAASGYFEPCEGLSEGESPRAVNAQASLAVIPAGTGDDFARGLAGGRRAPLDTWVARLVRHCRRDAFDLEDEGAAYLHRLETTLGVDVMLCGLEGGARRFVCLNAATLGIGAEVAARVAAQGTTARRLPGEARFALAAVPRLLAWRNRRVRVTVDGRVWRECGSNLIAVVNGAYAGGGMNFSPQASLTDGLLDVLAVCDISRPVLVRELSRVHSGGHLGNPKVKLTRARHVRVETLDAADTLGVEADGDPRGHAPADFRVMPAALRVVF
jgi:diacylglycerol kinase (ATP)